MDISNYDATLVKKLSLNDVRDIDFSLTGPGNAMTSPQTLYALSAAQIQVLSPKQLSDLSALYKSLSSVMPQGQISAISTAQIQTAATVDSFDEYLLNRMSKTQLSAFTAFSGGNDSALLAKLKPTTLSAFSPTALSTIDATEATALTIEQVKALQPAQLALLSDAVIAALGSSTSNHANVIKSLTTAQINALSDSALIAEIANLTNTQLKGLDASSLNANNGSNSFTSQLSASQAKQLTGSQIQQLTGSSLQDIQANLMPKQIKAITKDQLNDASFTPSATLITSGLTKAQIQQLDQTKLAAVIANFGAEEIGWLSKTQISNLTDAAIANIPTSAIVGLTAAQLKLMSEGQLQAFTAAQVKEMTVGQFSGLNTEQQKDLFTGIDHLSVKNVGYIKPEVIANMNPATFNNIPSDIMKGFTGPQIAAITPEQFSNITAADIVNIDSADMKYLTEAQIDVFTSAQLVALTKNQIQNLPTKIIALLTNEQVTDTTNNHYMDMSKFTPTQIKYLSTDVIGNLDITQTPQLTADQVLQFSKDQWFALGNKVAQLSDAAIKGLGFSQVTNMSSDQFAKLLTNTNFQISDLSVSAVQAMDAEKWDHMTYDLIDGLSAMQIKNLSINAISAFDKFDASLLSGTQTKALTATQLNAMALNAKEAFQSLGHDGSGTALNVYTATAGDDLGAVNINITNFFNVSILKQLGSETLKAFADNQETAFYTGTPSINGTAVTNTGTAALDIINQFITTQQVYLVGVSSGGVETAITGL